MNLRSPIIYVLLICTETIEPCPLGTKFTDKSPGLIRKVFIQNVARRFDGLNSTLSPGSHSAIFFRVDSNLKQVICSLRDK
jgi:hypothetical protein